jgi:hypothetical protein
LDVPVLNVEELDLEVDDLRVQVALRADLADLVKINVGLDINLDKVKLAMKGIEAQALLTIRLDKVLGTLNRALEAIDILKGTCTKQEGAPVKVQPKTLERPSRMWTGHLS